MKRINEPLADARNMFAVHRMLRREFSQMSRLVLAVKPNDRERVTIVADHIVLVSEVLRLHHAGEDKHIWPRLRARVAKNEIAPIIGMIEEQHNAIHEFYLQLKHAVKSWREDASPEWAGTVANALEELVPLLAEHLADEEERVVPLIERHITAAEYAALPREGAKIAPPEKLLTLFGMFMYDSEPSIIEQFAAQMPPELLPIIRDLGTKAYAAYARELYGTASPAHCAL
jgi:hemerythrin-like domain-containing protein